MFFLSFVLLCMGFCRIFLDCNNYCILWTALVYCTLVLKKLTAFDYHNFLKSLKIIQKKQSFSAETTKVKKSCLRINKDRFFIMVLQNSFTFISWIQLLSDTKCNICSLFELNYFLWEDDIFRKQKMFCFFKNTRRCSASLKISSSNKRK